MSGTRAQKRTPRDALMDGSEEEEVGAHLFWAGLAVEAAVAVGRRASRRSPVASGPRAPPAT
eukprot:5105263-Pleurochrysis_carterae.AAC.3